MLRLPAAGRRALLAGLAAVLVVSAGGIASARGTAGATPPAGSPVLPTPPWSGNLLSGDNANFNHGIGGWRPSSGSRATRTKLPTQSGKGAMSLVNLSRKIGSMYAQSHYVRATPGMRYAFNFWARGSIDPRSVSGELAFIDAKGKELVGVRGMETMDFTTSWVHITNTVAIAPPTAKYVVARTTVHGAHPGEVQFIDSASLQRARGGSINVVAPLHTSGNRMYDANGHLITLRGFVRMGMQGGTLNIPSAHDIGQAKAWGANVVRLALGEQKWPGLPQNSCHTDPAYPGQVDQAVNLITNMGMYALIEMHWNTIAACGAAKPYPMADCNIGACNANAFWTAVANRYKGNPRVGFDLYNEPHHITDAVWRNGGAVTWQGVKYTAAGMQPMYNAVRATGATNLVFVTGNSWGNLFPGPLSGTNIVYSAHSYTCPGNAPPKCTNPSPYDGSYYLKNWVAAGKKYPVFVGEFGFPAPSNSRYAQHLISYAEAHHWGWTEFCWGDNAFSRFDLLLNGGGAGTYEPAPGGMPALETFHGS